MDRLPLRRLAAVLITLSSPLRAAADSLPSCQWPTLYLTQDTIGLEGQLETLQATLQQEGDGGGPEIPIEVQPSREPACNSTLRYGYRIVAQQPLTPGASYVLSVQGRSWAPCVWPNADPLLIPFQAVGERALPVPPAVTPPELLVQRCPGRQDYYYFEVLAPSIAREPGVELRLSVDGALHYCLAQGMRGEHCAAGEQRVHRMQWVAEVPHTGLRSEGPVAEVVFDCDGAREAACTSAPPPGDAGLTSDAGAMSAEASVADTLPGRAAPGGCQLTGSSLPGGPWWLACLLVLTRRSRASRAACGSGESARWSSRRARAWAPRCW